jgi:hypothetical protein
MAFRLVGIRRSLLIGVVLGTVYGVCLRGLTDEGPVAQFLIVMSFAFVFVVPVAIGYLAVFPHPAASIWYRLFVPWIPVVLTLAVVYAFGSEGAICIVMAFPIMLLGASIGGLIAGIVQNRRAQGAVAFAVLPLLVGGVESRMPAPASLRTVESTIDIAAPASRVWREVVTVPPIERRELPDALYLEMGFPAPISATIDREGVGGVRRARFENGVLFLETVTDWQPERLLSFRIAAQTDSIPPTTLDPHVTIGGPFFDVFRGTYRLEPLADGRTRLRLTSHLRVATHFNVYSGWWVDTIMRSIQETILVVEKRRAESGARNEGSRS